jgi:3',5'-cyclic AMP phosphodiesterase CpdA
LQQLVVDARPDLLLLSGDITQRATRQQFAKARHFVDSLHIPHKIAIPGNHDIPLFNLAARLLRPYGNFSRAFGNQLEGHFENDRLLVLALNTTRWYRHIDGALSARQIDRVATHLQAAAAKDWRIVVTHQPLAVPHQRDTHDLLHGHQQALQCWAEAGADVVMGGHIHLPYVLPLHQRLPALPRRMWAVQAGTALSSRVRAGAPNSVNMLHVDDSAPGARALAVERWDYSDATRRFDCVSVQRLDDAPSP